MALNAETARDAVSQTPEPESTNTDVWIISTVETGMALYTAKSRRRSSVGSDGEDSTAGNHLTVSPEKFGPCIPHATQGVESTSNPRSSFPYNRHGIPSMLRRLAGAHVSTVSKHAECIILKASPPPSKTTEHVTAG